jgi:hypothetical protein
LTEWVSFYSNRFRVSFASDAYAMSLSKYFYEHAIMVWKYPSQCKVEETAKVNV